MSEPREVSVKEAARAAGVTPRYIRRLLNDGRLKGRQIDGWVWLVERQSLERWIEGRGER